MNQHIAELLAEYGSHRRAEAQATKGSSEKHSEEARRVADELRRFWADDGDDPSELEKLLRQADFREQVRGLYRGSAILPWTREYNEATETQKLLTGELRDFWLSSGHDLNELRKFESKVDSEVASLIAK
jgi:hypothetical protein